MPRQGGAKQIPKPAGAPSRDDHKQQKTRERHARENRCAAVLPCAPPLPPAAQPHSPAGSRALAATSSGAPQRSWR